MAARIIYDEMVLNCILGATEAVAILRGRRHRHWSMRCWRTRSIEGDGDDRNSAVFQARQALWRPAAGGPIDAPAGHIEDLLDHARRQTRAILENPRIGAAVEAIADALERRKLVRYPEALAIADRVAVHPFVTT